MLHGGWITNISILKPRSSVSPDLRQKAFPVQFRSRDSIRIWLPSRCDKARNGCCESSSERSTRGRQFEKRRHVHGRCDGCEVAVDPLVAAAPTFFPWQTLQGNNENRNVDSFVIVFRVDKCCKVIIYMKVVDACNRGQQMQKYIFPVKSISKTTGAN